MTEAIENVCVKKNGTTLRGRHAEACLPCHDRGANEGPIPTVMHGDFTVRLGDVMAGRVLEELEIEFAKFGGVAGAVSGFLSMIHWVEEELPRKPTCIRRGQWRSRATQQGGYGCSTWIGGRCPGCRL